MTMLQATRQRTRRPFRLLLSLMAVAFLLLTFPRIYTFAAQYTQVTADNSVMLANALGQQRNFEQARLSPICFIKIHSVQRDPHGTEGGVSYSYNVHGCPVDEFRGFGVCKSGACDVKPYQVEVFQPTGATTATLVNVWEL